MDTRWACSGEKFIVPDTERHMMIELEFPV